MGDEGMMRIGRRCFVGNLAWSTSWQDLKDVFKEAGTVVYANVVRDGNGQGRSKGWGIVEFETPEQALNAVGKFNGTELAGLNIIVREDREDRDLKDYNRQNGVESTKRPPKKERGGGGGGGGGGGEAGGGGGSDGNAAPRERKPRPEQPPAVPGEEQCSGLQVVVHNLPWSVTWQQLKDHFASCGSVDRADIQQDNRTGKSKGYGTIRFTETSAASSAISKFNETEFEGRTIKVAYDRYA
ncbi:RRM domain-containing protein [Pseudoscourfieldia marina]